MYHATEFMSNDHRLALLREACEAQLRRSLPRISGPLSRRRIVTGLATAGFRAQLGPTRESDLRDFRPGRETQPA